MHLVSIDDLTDDQIATILDEGERWFAYNRQPRRNDHRLDGLTVVNAFFENSTRTLLSFAIAANRLYVITHAEGLEPLRRRFERMARAIEEAG